MIHLVKVTVDPSRLEDYKQILKEEIEISLRTEPDVYVLYGNFRRMGIQPTLHGRMISLPVSIRSFLIWTAV